MKKDSWFLTVMILGVVAGSFMLQGCNDDNNKRPMEPGEPLVITEQVTLECDTPFSFKVIGLFQDTNVSTEYNETKESYTGEWGVDISYTVVTPCVPCEDGNVTIDKVDPTIPIDGNCECGYELNDCGTVCVESQGICGEGMAMNTETNVCEIACDEGFEKDENGTCTDTRLTCGEGTVLNTELNQCVLPTDDCGEGTVMDPETETCIPVTPLECSKGTVNVDEVCEPVVYKREGEDCLEGYIEGPKGYLCVLESEIDRPSPK